MQFNTCYRVPFQTRSPEESNVSERGGDEEPPHVDEHSVKMFQGHLKGKISKLEKISNQMTLKKTNIIILNISSVTTTVAMISAT